ncbi:uncharacterized protein B0H18DRAFT_1130507 [Fomitopsis serialis]|uniref:uncharacterized protein n=1 Tax=Fomitopsis serialis TaxID=139415 RepID=UPI002008D7F3|nr:uncharacterized protein B0H18DRAFT_1130507 [Neoantrodia serialis]KAH9910228.1 hypothetical protein B0H18DRAFT_1130507 [Neoantrodia serialis]
MEYRGGLGNPQWRRPTRRHPKSTAELVPGKSTRPAATSKPLLLSSQPPPPPLCLRTPASKKGRAKKKAVKVDSPAETEVSLRVPETGGKAASEARPRRSTRQVDPELQELAREIRTQERAERGAFEKAREKEIANPTITQPRSAKAQAYKDRVWLPSGKKRERKESEVAASPMASAVKRGRVTKTDDEAATAEDSGDHWHQSRANARQSSPMLFGSAGREVSGMDKDIEMDRTDTTSKKPVGSVSMSEPEQDSDYDFVQSDAGREDDEDFDVEHEAGVSQHKAERIAQQLRQGTATFVSKPGRKSRDNLTDDKASSDNDSEYKADFLDDDDSQLGSDEDESSERDDSESNGEHVPDPAWQAMIVRHAQRRTTGKSVTAPVGLPENRVVVGVEGSPRGEDVTEVTCHIAFSLAGVLSVALTLWLEVQVDRPSQLTKVRGSPGGELVKEANRAPTKPSEQTGMPRADTSEGLPAPALPAHEHFVDEHFVVVARKPRGGKAKAQTPITDDRAQAPAPPQTATKLVPQGTTKISGGKVHKRIFGTSDDDEDSLAEPVVKPQPKPSRPKGSNEAGVSNRANISKTGTS